MLAIANSRIIVNSKHDIASWAQPIGSFAEDY